ncbi:MAG TPA: hypothetical protein VHQ92_00995 [Pseudolabrys sp.]|jgi:hypothetical protein|nr:hypothetical protein [Pseudolabrys sp.]
MSFLSDILPVLGGVGGFFLGGPAGAAIGAGIGGSIGGSIASGDAASAQANASNQAQQTELAMFQQNQANLAPWLQTGQQGNQALQQWLGLGQGGSFNPNAPGVAPFNASMLPGDPSYQWRLQQGENALLNNASAMGGLGGGNTQKALLNYGQGAASQQYQQALQNYMAQQNNVYNKLSGVSNTGVNAAGQVAGLGANAASNIASLQNQTGATNAAGILGSQNVLASGIGGGINNYLLASLLSQGGFGGGSVNSLGANNILDAGVSPLMVG